jgi:antitoxin (DNA-binding transcriptional repressor) of toxin-antitoxin stability system
MELKLLAELPRLKGMKKPLNSADEPRATVSEMRKSLARVLDQAANGATIHVLRRGVEVCVITPPTAGRKASEILERLRGCPPVYLDDEFGRDLMEILSMRHPPSIET